MSPLVISIHASAHTLIASQIVEGLKPLHFSLRVQEGNISFLLRRHGHSVFSEGLAAVAFHAYRTRRVKREDTRRYQSTEELILVFSSSARVPRVPVYDEAERCARKVATHALDAFNTRREFSRWFRVHEALNGT